MPKIVPWDQVRTAFITRNIDPTAERFTTLRELALEYSCNYSHLREKAAEQDWTGQLAAAAREVSEAAIDQAKEDAKLTESEVRLRQQRIARKAADLGEAVLDSTMWKYETLLAEDPNKAFIWVNRNIKGLTSLLRVGLAEERRAIGLPDEVAHSAGDGGVGVRSRMAETKRLKELGEGFLKSLGGSG